MCNRCCRFFPGILCAAVTSMILIRHNFDKAFGAGFELSPSDRVLGITSQENAFDFGSAIDADYGAEAMVAVNSRGTPDDKYVYSNSSIAFNLRSYFILGLSIDLYYSHDAGELVEKGKSNVTVKEEYGWFGRWWWLDEHSYLPFGPFKRTFISKNDKEDQDENVDFSKNAFGITVNFNPVDPILIWTIAEYGFANLVGRHKKARIGAVKSNPVYLAAGIEYALRFSDARFGITPSVEISYFKSTMSPSKDNMEVTDTGNVADIVKGKMLGQAKLDKLRVIIPDIMEYNTTNLRLQLRFDYISYSNGFRAGVYALGDIDTETNKDSRAINPGFGLGFDYVKDNFYFQFKGETVIKNNNKTKGKVELKFGVEI